MERRQGKRFQFQKDSDTGAPCLIGEAARCFFDAYEYSGLSMKSNVLRRQAVFFSFTELVITIYLYKR